MYDKTQYKEQAAQKAQALKSGIDGYINQLIEGTDSALKSEQVLDYLKFQSQFHGYSWNNCLLIMLQNRNASMVAGYRKWQSLGRQVKKGEKGIAILAPCFYKVDPAKSEDDSKSVTFFKTVYVFDVSQTEGDELPQAPEWRSPARQDELTARLTAYAETLGVRVTVEDLGTAQGRLTDGHIALAETAGTKTLAHELAHCLLGHLGNGALTHDIKEIEAEATAYVVCEHFGIEAAGSANYIALWAGSSKEIKARFAIIQKAAQTIIEAVEGKGEIENG